MNLERLPPQDIEVETMLIGCLISEKDVIFQISEIIEPKDFYKDNNKEIYEVMLKMFNEGTEIDLISLQKELEKKNLVQKIGGLTYLAKCMNAVATTTKAKYYAEIVKDKSIRRQLIIAQASNENVIYNTELSIETVLAETQNKIFSISKLDKKDDSSRAIVKELEKVQINYAEKYEQGQKIIGISTGIEKIDELIDGLRESHVWVVGAYTSTGKTQFALNIVNSVLEQNVPTSVISLEMSKIDTMARLIGIRHNISSMRVIKGINDSETSENIKEGKWFLEQAPLFVHTSYFELEKIKMIIRKDCYMHKVKFFVLDYVQNIMSSKGLREYDLLTSSAIEMQSLARELGITIYIVSQISNDAEKGLAAGAGFKGSGALEAVADLAIRLKRDKSKEDTTSEYVPVKIVVTKNRHGFTGCIEDYVMYLKSGIFAPKPIQEQVPENPEFYYNQDNY